MANIQSNAKKSTVCRQTLTYLIKEYASGRKVGGDVGVNIEYFNNRSAEVAFGIVSGA